MGFRRAPSLSSFSKWDLGGLAQRCIPFGANRNFNEKSITDSEELVSVVVTAAAITAVACRTVGVIGGVCGHKGLEYIGVISGAISSGVDGGDNYVVFSLNDHLGALVV